MFEIETAIREWRVTLQRQLVLSPEALDELEDHLRAEYQTHTAAGESPARAFTLARDRLGQPTDLAGEFQKVEPMVWRHLLGAGWVLFVVSFFLPAHVASFTLFNIDLGRGVLPGVEAFFLALGGEAGVVGLMSALTNAVMLATPFWWSRRRSNFLWGLTAAVLAAAIMNGWWLFYIDPMAELRIGYYLWWASFMFVGSGLAMRARLVTRARHIPLTA
jgi:hypothetical protein